MDNLATLQAESEEYRGNVVRLGWLLDPHTWQVWIYRPDQAAELLQEPERLKGEDVLAGFRLELQKL